MRSADHSIFADITLPVVRCGRQEGLSDRLANRFRNPVDRVARSFVEQNDLLGEASSRRAEIEPTGGYGLTGEEFFCGKRIEQRLQRPAAIDQLATLTVCLAGLVIGDPDLPSRTALDEVY